MNTNTTEAPTTTPATATAKKNELHVSVWTEPGTSTQWLIVPGEGWTYQSYKRLPSVVACNGRTFVKSGWNSDTGNAAYRQATDAEIATTVRK